MCKLPAAVGEGRTFRKLISSKHKDLKELQKHRKQMRKTKMAFGAFYIFGRCCIIKTLTKIIVDDMLDMKIV